MRDSAADNRLVQAYRQMMERVRAGLDELELAEREFLPDLQRRIERAAAKAVELGELTHDEAQLIGGYLKRDLEDAGHYLATTGQDLSAWLRFDLSLLEERLLELLQSAADHTRLELMAFEATTALRSVRYHAGEITGPGTLACVHCGEELLLTVPQEIPPCPHCNAQRYRRLSVDPG